MHAAICPTCRNELREGAQFCRACGTAAATAEAPAESHMPSVALPSMSADRGSACGNCGTRLRGGAQFCVRCGSADVIAEGPAVSSQAPTESHPLAAGVPVMTAATHAFAAAPNQPETPSGPPTPIPPVPQPPAAAFAASAHARPPPVNPPPRRSGNSLAPTLLGVVAAAGIAVGALAATGVFSHSTPTQTVTSVATARPALPKSTVPAAQATTSKSSAVTAPRAASARGTISCGGDLSVGPNTSCSFAQNVEQAYDQSTGGTTVVTAHSPVTGLNYTIDCTGGSPHVCTGGSTHNASVYFTSGPSHSTPKANPPPQPSATTTGEFASFAGTWGAHEQGLVIDASGTGRLSYQDLTACPSCSFASAPTGSIDFALRSVTNGEGTGTVTASSDPRNGAVGAPVQVSLSAASPGQFLHVVIGGKQLINFCNSTSEGQCGA